MKQNDCNSLLNLLRGRMKLTGPKGLVRSKKLLVAFAALSLQMNAYAYSQNISISFKNASPEKILKSINQQTGYSFLYNAELIKKIAPISIDVKNAPLKDVLMECFKGENLSFVLENNTIVIKESKETGVDFKKNEFVQQFVEGTVVDEKGNPIAGVTVAVDGKPELLTVTDMNGKFKILFPSDASTLVFSSIGFTSEKVKVGSNRNIKVTLSAESEDLDLVIVAYGAKKREELTTSVAKISSKDFEKRPISNVSNAIAGAAPGVQSNSGNGAPGSGSTIRIRGFGSISGDNAPLYILDGVPYEGVLNNLNPDDIESISILKDAASTAIYGARGANGIIVITTKKGIKNKTRVDFKAVQGFSTRGLSSYEKVDAYRYYELLWESLRNKKVEDGTALEVANQEASEEIYDNLKANPFGVPNNQIVLPNGKINPAAKLLATDDLDWREQISQLGLRNEYNVSIYGGTDKSDYFTSLGYLKERGYTLKSDFERASARVKMNSQVTKWFKLGSNISGNFTRSQESIENSGLNENPFYIDLLVAPIYYLHKHDPITGEYLYDSKGEKIADNGDDRPIFTGRNILLETRYNINRLQRNVLNSRFYGTINFTKNLSFTNNFAFDVNNYQMLVFDSPEIGDSKGKGRTYDTRSNTKYLTVNQILNYNKTFEDHSLSVMLGHEYYQRQYDYIRGRKEMQTVEGSIQLDNFSNFLDILGYQDNYKLESYFGRLEYDYNKKYFVGGSFRNDISSKFHPDNRSGWFFSASAGWAISNEEWFNIPFVDNLKLRGSWGQVGSDEAVGLYAWQSLYNFGNSYNYANEAGLRMQSTMGNPNIKWETTNVTDLALEFSLLKNRLNGEIEYFHRYTKDLLFSSPLPNSSGNSSMYDNVGNMLNTGLEISLNGDVVRNKNFKWNLAANATFFKNVIKKLPQDEIINGTKKYSVGVSMYEFWLRDFYGVDPNTGKELYVTSNLSAADAYITHTGDTVTTDAAQAKYKYFGSVIPKVYGGITNTFSYKNFTLSALLTYQIGGKVFDNDYQSLMHNGTFGRAVHVDALNRWQNPGDVTDVPKRTLGNTMYDSDRFLTSGSYLTLRSASLSYDLNKSVLNKLHATSARVFVTGDNLFIKAARKGLNPTQVYSGSPSYTYAPARTITIGVNVSF